MVKISVIIPVHNAEKYLEECLISVANQTFNDIEIICVNDGSTDNSLKILNEFQKQDKRIKILTQENQGPSIARNNAMKLAQGEYIGFVDADDWIDLDFYEKLYNAITEEKSDIACCNIKYVVRKEAKYLLKYKKNKKVFKPSDLFKLFGMPKYNYIWHRIYRREFILNNNFFFREGVYYEDIIWLTQIMEKCRTAVSVPSITYYYRYNENSIVNTTKNNSKKKQDLIAAFNFQNDYIIQNHIKVKPRFNREAKGKILGLHLFDVKELSDCLKIYYFLGIPLISVKTRKMF